MMLSLEEIMFINRDGEKIGIPSRKWKTLLLDLTVNILKSLHVEILLAHSLRKGDERLSFPRGNKIRDIFTGKIPDLFTYLTSISILEPKRALKTNNSVSRP